MAVIALQQTMGCVNQSGHINAYLMAPGVARSVAVPAGAGKVFFGVDPIGTAFYVNQNGTAAVAAADALDGSASELCPDRRKCSAGASISLVAEESCVITASFYK